MKNKWIVCRNGQAINLDKVVRIYFETYQEDTIYAVMDNKDTVSITKQKTNGTFLDRRKAAVETIKEIINGTRVDFYDDSY